MSIRSRTWLLIAALTFVASAAKSDGIGSFAQGQSIFGGIGSTIVPAAPPLTGALMLEDGTSFLLLEDSASNLCLEGGC